MNIHSIKHDDICINNAFKCARENLRDDETISNDSIDDAMIQRVANDYLNSHEFEICSCAQRIENLIENELRELYSHERNLQFKIEQIRDSSLFHVLFSYDDYDTKFVNSMIVETNDVTKYNSNFTNFRSLNEMYI